MKPKQTTQYIIQGKTVKLSVERYNALSQLLNGQKQRTKVLEGLIEVLIASVKKNKYILFDVLTDPELLELRYLKQR